jgi:hypothetical protein
MSLFDKLNNGETKLKSLKYGHDREGGGSSNQPYIKTPLDVNLPPALDFLSNDFILRGGPVGAPLAAATDVARLSKYFTDLKSPSGLLFIAKQNLLSRIAVRTEASGKFVNEGVYTPLSTLSQAAVGFTGIHLNKQGLNPIPGSIYSLRNYEDAVKANNRESANNFPSSVTAQIPNPNYVSFDQSAFESQLQASELGPGGIGDVFGSSTSTLVPQFINETRLIPALFKNRLLDVWYNKQFNGNRTQNVLVYSGGPNSILGIGKTRIRFADQRTGINNPLYGKNPNYLKYKISDPTASPSIQNPIGVSAIYKNLEPSSSGNLENNLLSLKTSPFSGSSNYQYAAGLGPQNVYSFTNDTFKTTTIDESINGAYVFTQQELIDKTPYRISPVNLTDFRKTIRDKIEGNQTAEIIAYNNILSDSPDYSTKNIENRVKLGDPGKAYGKNLKSYTLGAYSGSASRDSFDKITASPLHDGGLNSSLNDLVKFRIGAIDNDIPSNITYMNFRAFLGSINDSYNGEWNPQRYVGRGENFYTYAGFDRKISLSFTVAAQSKIELIPMYKKLNYLASQLAPDYSKTGYMRGPLITLTIGGYLYEQPGFITSLTYEMSEETPWEIGINDDATDDDSSVKELPHMIKVTGFNFTPIHTFAPRKQLGTSGNGSQRYIALQASSSNYNDAWPTIKY